MTPTPEAIREDTKVAEKLFDNFFYRDSVAFRILNNATRLAELLEKMPEEKLSRIGFRAEIKGFNDCRQRILNILQGE